MPTYQYVCTECGGQLEAVQKFTDEALTVHEDCGGRLRKVFSPVGIVFKGSGFYKTDSRGSGSSGSSSPAKSDASSSSSASDSSSATPAKSDSASSSTSSTDTAKSSTASKSASSEKVA